MSEVNHLREAVAKLVRDGDPVALEGFTHLIPTAGAPAEILPPGPRGPDPHTAKGKSKREIVRCPKRYIARETYRVRTSSAVGHWSRLLDELRSIRETLQEASRGAEPTEAVRLLRPEARGSSENYTNDSSYLVPEYE